MVARKLQIAAHGKPVVHQHLNHGARFSFAPQFPFELSATCPLAVISATGHAGPFNRNNVAVSPGDAQVYVKGLDPVAAGFLIPMPH